MKTTTLLNKQIRTFDYDCEQTAEERAADIAETAEFWRKDPCRPASEAMDSLLKTQGDIIFEATTGVRGYSRVQET